MSFKNDFMALVTERSWHFGPWHACALLASSKGKSLPTDVCEYHCEHGGCLCIACGGEEIGIGLAELDQE